MEPLSDPPTLHEAPHESAASQPRSRRALLTAALGGLAGAVAGALGRPAEAQAAAGDSMKLGQSNYAGSAGTRLTANSSGGAFWLTQQGFGSGVRGDSFKGHGGVFTTGHPDRHGLLAQQTAGPGNGAAVKAEGGPNIAVSAVSADEFAVYAQSGASSAVYATSNGGNAVAGSSVSAAALYGISSFGYGIYASAQNSHAGFFNGSVHVAGTLSKSGGTFRIDHPIDPSNRILQHSFVESPDMKNVYDGVVITDAAGEATVELPAYFEALNSDVRYQLTVIGSFASAMVKREVHEGRFIVATSEPSTKVSWQLTGIRRDAWANAHRVEVELDKTGDQKGKYLNPVEHGQPASKGVDFEQQQRDAKERERASAAFAPPT